MHTTNNTIQTELTDALRWTSGISPALIRAVPTERLADPPGHLTGSQERGNEVEQVVEQVVEVESRNRLGTKWQELKDRSVESVESPAVPES